MAKKALSQPKIDKPLHNCLTCSNGSIGALDLIYCKFCVTPQPSRNRYCIDYKKRETN